MDATNKRSNENVMNIQINNQNIKIVFSSRANISKSASGIQNATVIFSKNEKVMDEPRGFLKYVNSQWVFYGLYQITPKAFEKMVIVLESPHKDEFSSMGVPIRPANGVTGSKINLLLAQIVNNRPPNGISQSIIYEVYLVNAIQYQTSCYQALHNYSDYNANWHTIRNYVFKALWNTGNLSLQQDLRNRINLINPSVIMNCVTGGKAKNGLRSIVEKVVNSKNLYPHPSAWK